MPVPDQKSNPNRLAEALAKTSAEAQQQSEKEILELVGQIGEQRKTLEQAALKVHELSVVLQSKARRASLEGSGHYILYSTAHLRLAGAIGQAVKRTVSMDRVLDKAKSEAEENRRIREADRLQASAREAKKRIAETINPPIDYSFEELYGEFQEGALDA